MCEKRTGEPIYSYAFRQVVEKPAAFACIGLIAAARKTAEKAKTETGWKK